MGKWESDQGNEHQQEGKMSKTMTGRLWEMNGQIVCIDAGYNKLAAIRTVVDEVAQEVGLTLQVQDYCAATMGHGRTYLVWMQEKGWLGNIAKLNQAYLLLQERFVPPDGARHGLLEDTASR